MTLQERIDAINLSDFKIEEVTKTDKFTLIKAIKECPIYFAFYSHFIVCSGDYGEWVFDCTWETNKRNIPGSMSYLLGKLSHDCNKYWFDNAQLPIDFSAAKDAFYETYDINDSYGDDVKNAVDELFEDFYFEIKMSDKYRIVSVVDDYAERICDEMSIDFDTESWNSFYEAGETLNGQLVVNLAMLQKIRDEEILCN